MPKYYDFKVVGYYLYFTSFCVVECMHVHASYSKLTEGGSAKFFVKSNGDTVLQTKASSATVRWPGFPSLSRNTIRKCTFAGRSTARRSTTRNNPSA